MKDQILVINSGSSSLKLSLFSLERNPLHLLVQAECKALNSPTPILEISENKEKQFFAEPLTCKKALFRLLDQLEKKGLFSKVHTRAIGHRFVHGGSSYTQSTRLTENVICKLDTLSSLAPLHNPPSLEAIAASRAYFGPSLPQVAVFDTAFHSTIPEHAAYYAIPYDLSEKYQIRRYGFHGISHAYLWNEYASFTGNNEGKIITCHLGNGCSITAIENGRSLDTSMGFTPAEGLVMATRAGDVDSGVIAYLAEKENKTASEIQAILNTQSGLLGVSGSTSRMEELTCAYDQNKRARLSIDLFCYRVAKYIGAYTATLGTVDAIILSGGIGENSSFIRKKISERLQFLHVVLDDEKNQGVNVKKTPICTISNKDSPVLLLVMATDENRFIAEEAKKLLNL
jgi:acetate kinase